MQESRSDAFGLKEARGGAEAEQHRAKPLSNASAIKADPVVSLGDDLMAKVLSFVLDLEAMTIGDNYKVIIGSQTMGKGPNIVHHSCLLSFYGLGFISPEWGRLADRVLARLKLNISLQFKFPFHYGFSARFMKWMCKQSESFSVASFQFQGIKCESYQELLKIVPVFLHQCDTSNLASATLDLWSRPESHVKEKNLLEEVLQCPRLEKLHLKLWAMGTAGTKFEEIISSSLFSNESISTLKIRILGDIESDFVKGDQLFPRLSEAISSLPSLSDLELESSGAGYLSDENCPILSIHSESLKHLRLHHFGWEVRLAVDCPQLASLECPYHTASRGVQLAGALQFGIRRSMSSLGMTLTWQRGNP